MKPQAYEVTTREIAIDSEHTVKTYFIDFTNGNGYRNSTNKADIYAWSKELESQGIYEVCSL